MTHNLFDGVNGGLQAALRGCGRQSTTAKVSLATWYGLALPLSWCLCFLGGMDVFGLWTGLMVAATTTCIVQVRFLLLLRLFCDCFATDFGLF